MFIILQLESHHKYAASTTEMNRLKSEGAKAGLARKAEAAKAGSEKIQGKLCKGTVSISGLTLPLKNEFVKMLNTSDGIHEDIHYFVCLVKYRSQVCDPFFNPDFTRDWNNFYVIRNLQFTGFGWAECHGE